MPGNMLPNFQPSRFRPLSGGVSISFKAALLILVGQSLNSVRGSSLQTAPGSLNSGAEMAVGGAALTSFDFYSGNVEHPSNFTDWASLATFSESGTQSPLAGVSNTLTGYADVVLTSAAIGARSIEVLHSTFYHVAAAVEQGTKLLVAKGYELEDIEIIFSYKHGEANATAGSTKATYKSRAVDYISRCRTVTKQIKRDANYVAPFHLAFPVQQKEQDDDRVIKEALLEIALEDPKMYFGEMWSVPIDTDRVHPTNEGYILGGERLGLQLNSEHDPMRCLSATLTNGGDSFQATFNKNVVRDTSLGRATALNAANAEDGIEFHNGTSFVAISNLVYSGVTITGDLASTQTGGELRIAVQDVDGTVISGTENQVGCFVRSDEAGVASIFDPTYTHYDYCIPQVVEMV